MPYKDKTKRNEYMRNYYLKNPEQKVKHDKLNAKYREGLKHAKNSLQST